MLVVAVLLWSAIATTRADAETAGSVTLDQSVYTGLDSTGFITVTDADLNISGNPDTATVTVTSTSDGTGFTMTLNETGKNTGIFTNQGAGTVKLGFTTGSSNAATGQLQIADGDTATVTYQDANPPATRNATATFHSATGTISFDSAEYFPLNATAVITLADGDLDTTSNPDTTNVTVRSTSDGTGFSMTLKETGKNTGIFTSQAQGMNLGVTNGASDGTNKLIKVAAGDMIMVSYADASPSGTRTTTALWNPPVAGTVSLDAVTYVGYTALATMTVSDPNLNTDIGTKQTIVVQVSSTTDPFGIARTLTETGNNTGVFTANNLGFNSGASSGNNIQVSDGDTVTVRYFDASPAGVRTETAVWYANATGVVSLDASSYSAPLQPPSLLSRIPI